MSTAGQTESTGRQTEPFQSRLGALETLLGVSVALIGFATDYGPAAISILVFVCAGSVLWHLYKGKSIEESALQHPRGKLTFFAVVWTILVLAAAGFVMSIFLTQATVDILRPSYGNNPIDIEVHQGSQAPWNKPKPGTNAEVNRAHSLAGWKRLMNSAVVNDPINSKQAVRQLFYVESVTFQKNYKTFDAELEMPTSIEIVELYAFLTQKKASRSGYERLETLRTTYPLGVDKNRAEIAVASPNNGEALLLFVVASTKNNQSFPSDMQNRFALRSIK